MAGSVRHTDRVLREHVVSAPAPDIILDVDLRNPGQFFACCGLLELASRLWAGAEGWFEGTNAQTRFHITAPGAGSEALNQIVDRLCDSKPLVAIAPDEGIQTMQADRRPVVLLPFDLRLDWWLDSYASAEKSELKVWAGQQTPERNIKNLQQLWQQMRARQPGGTSDRLLFDRWPATGRFGFDPAASWAALDVGFSPDEQQLAVHTAPATELLAAVGLQRCRPSRIERESGRWFSYRAWMDPLEIAVVPAAVADMGRRAPGYVFPVVMRNSQYGSFGWARPLGVER
jgi:CRISPR-associated protein Csx14